MGGQQLAVDDHVILPRIAVTQFFKIGAQQPVIAHVLPMLQHPGQPCTVDFLGRGNTLQEIQGMGLVREIPTRPTLLSRLKIEGIVTRHIGTMLFRP
ncbi:hypothetical protein D9M71_711130 [compost metagenome]